MHAQGTVAEAGRLPLWGLLFALGLVASVGGVVSLAVAEPEPEFVPEEEPTHHRRTARDSSAGQEEASSGDAPADARPPAGLPADGPEGASSGPEPEWSPEEAIDELDHLWDDLERLRRPAKKGPGAGDGASEEYIPP